MENQNNLTENLSRREALKKIAVVGGALSAFSFLNQDLLAQQEAKTDDGEVDMIASADLKTVIKNGSVYHQQQLKKLYVGITEQNTIKVSEKPLTAKNIIDAKGKIVSQGFVDILADNAGSPETTYRIFEKYKLTDGATSVLQMHGGSAYPAAFHQKFDPLPHYVNYGVSVFVMILRLRFMSFADRMKYTEKALQEGALGVAHSIEYQPTSYEELVGYAKLAAKYDRPFFLHLRYSAKETELEGVKEAIKLSKETGARIHIDHLHSTGGTFNMPKALELIQNANLTGGQITTCVYPYSYWATYLISKRFDPGWQKNFGLTYSDLTVVGTGQKLTEGTFNAYRSRPGLLVAVPEGTMAFDKTIDLALQTDFCMIGSDGGIESEPKANNHPRGAGCFATAIRHGIDMGMSMEKTLSKVTTLPCRLMKGVMDTRNDIANGKVADIVIFNPKTINGKASVANPNQYSEGIDHIFVNGTLVYEDNKILASKGKPIRYTTQK
ncbi:MAG: nitrate reductase [Bacteroidetes bacterium]|nr:MAG: nitrate reductase [Bacteroidota bacterium]